MNVKSLLVGQLVVLAFMGSAFTSSAETAKPATASTFHNSTSPITSSASAASPNTSEQLILVGHVTWQGRPDQPDPQQQLPVYLQLRQGNTEVVSTLLSTVADGSFSVDVSDLPTGVYNYRIKGPKFLANAGTVELTGNATTDVEMGLMRAGDANDDNVVNIQDFSIVKAAFGMALGDSRYDDRADFTGDQVVNIADYNWLRINFGQDGASPLTP